MLKVKLDQVIDSRIHRYEALMAIDDIFSKEIQNGGLEPGTVLSTSTKDIYSEQGYSRLTSTTPVNDTISFVPSPPPPGG